MRMWPALVLALLSVSTAHAAELGPRVAGERESRRYEPCGRVTGRDKLRCEAKIKRITRRHSRFNQQSIQRTYERLDLGHGRIREKEKSRIIRRSNARARGRRTFRQQPSASYTNVENRGFLNEHRRNQLDCMLMRHGRPRALCLEKASNSVRSKMRETRGIIRNWRE